MPQREALEKQQKRQAVWVGLGLTSLCSPPGQTEDRDVEFVFRVRVSEPGKRR